MEENGQGKVLNVIEKVLFSMRYSVMVVVVGALLGAIAMLLVGGIEVWEAISGLIVDGIPHDGHGAAGITIRIIASVDSFLFATVLLIFSLGVYELFISKIDHPEDAQVSRDWLKIRSIDDLKEALGKVILMILVVRLFEAASALTYEEPKDLLYLGASIALVALALFLTHVFPGKAAKGAEESH